MIGANVSVFSIGKAVGRGGGGVPMSWQYTGTTFTASSVQTPTAITWDGNYFRIVDYTNNRVYLYTYSGSAASYFNIGSQDTQGTGITFDGTHLWVVGQVTDKAYKYTTAGSYTGTSFNTGLNAPRGITWDGTHFWVIGYGYDIVKKFTSSGTDTGTSFSVASEDGNARDIVWDGTFFNVSGVSTNRVYQYTSAGVYTGNSFSTSTDGAAYGLGFDGTYLWTLSLATKKASKWAYLPTP